MKIWLLEPYFSGSHQSWCLELAEHGQNSIKIHSLEKKSWKWCLQMAAMEMTSLLQVSLQKETPDLIMASSMLDLATLAGLVSIANIPKILYFHENQFAYPASPRDKDIMHQRDVSYGLIQLKAAACAQEIWFNSEYNFRSFWAGVNEVLTKSKQTHLLESVKKIKERCTVVPLGINLYPLASRQSKNKIPIILWNHRWEYDKNPIEFFETLKKLKEEGSKFQLIVLGHAPGGTMDIFGWAQSFFSKEIIHWGYVKSKEDYWLMLGRADIVFSTSFHDFFGISILEAVSAGATPLLPHRLAYPEHFDNPEIFYHNSKEAIQKLRELLEYPEKRKSYADQIQQYCWSHMAQIYDQKFEQLVAKNKE